MIWSDRWSQIVKLLLLMILLQKRLWSSEDLGTRLKSVLRLHSHTTNCRAHYARIEGVAVLVNHTHRMLKSESGLVICSASIESLSAHIRS